MSLDYADRSKCFSVHSLLTVYSVVFSFVGLYNHFSAWNHFCPKMLLWLQDFIVYGVKELTQLLVLCQLLIGMCEYFLIDAGLSCCVLAEKCFPNKGIIIPTYFCVSCSPDIQRVVMEIKHGPQGQGKLVHCSVTVTSYLTPFLCNSCHYLIYHDDIHTVYT